MRLPYSGTYTRTQDYNDPCCRASYSKFSLMGHNGWDIGLPEGTKVLSPHSGRVIEVVDEGKVGYGKYVKIENGQEGSVLAHLSKQSVGVGEQVPEGGLVGYSGNTGNSTGPHLHWGYFRFPRKRTNGFVGFIDQEHWLNHKCANQDFGITDQTRIPQIGDKEVQQIMAELGAKDARIKELERDYNGALAQANDIKRQLTECSAELAKWQQGELNSGSTSPVNPPNSSDYSITQLLTMLVQKIFV